MGRDVIKAIIGDTAAVLPGSPDLHPFPGVPALLAGLAARFDVVVVTSNAGGVVRDFLARERLDDQVSDVLGVEVDAEQGAQDRRRDGALSGPAALLLRRRHPRRHARGRPGRRRAAGRRLGLARRGGAQGGRRGLRGRDPAELLAFVVGEVPVAD